MTDREKELQNRLDGLEVSMPKQFWKLAEILELQVLEISYPTNESTTDCLIPYMMNDAVENYLILKNCKMTGEYLKDKEVVLPARLVKNETYILVVRQEGGTLFTLQFSGIQEHLQCYQYHRIGHFWVKGQEQWRQLVYMLGTIHDKYEYIGENVCNEKEVELMPLMEFPPLRFYSPIHESLDGKYPFTYDGIDCMEKIAEEAGDKWYARFVRLYRRFPIWILGKMLCKRLLLPKSEKLYQLIFQKIESASAAYGERIYEPKLQEAIEEKRKQIHGVLHKKGFEGNYPKYRKQGKQVVVVEEHPFVMEEFEYEDYGFRVRFMVSKVTKGHVEGWNSGFFFGIGRSGEIVNHLDNIT